MILHPARIFSETGSLADVGSVFRAQLTGLPDQWRQGFWFNYVVPVWVFAAFFKIFGASDFTFYLAQFLLWGLILLTLIRKNLRVSQAVILISLIFTLNTAVEATFLSPSQLLMIAITVFVWRRWEQPLNNREMLSYGSLFGFSMHCRPETVFIFGIYLLLGILKLDSVRRRARFFALSIGSFAVLFLGIYGMRSALGGQSSSAHTFYLMGTDVAAPGFQTLSMEKGKAPSSFISEPALRKNMAAKAVSFWRNFFAAKTALYKRHDLFLIPLILGLCFFRNRFRTEAVCVVGLLTVQSALQSFLYDAPRYYDYIFVLALWIVFEFFYDWTQQTLDGSKWSWVLLALSASLTIQPFYELVTSHERRESFEKIMAQSDFAHSHIGREAYVVTDYAERWQWYGQGHYACFAPLNCKDYLQMCKQLPEAYIVLFEGRARIGGDCGEPLPHPSIPTAKTILLYSPATKS